MFWNRQYQAIKTIKQIKAKCYKERIKKKYEKMK
jgi:hypothetical protein